MYVKYQWLKLIQSKIWKHENKENVNVIIPSGILGWREAKAEATKRKARQTIERGTAIWAWK